MIRKLILLISSIIICLPLYAETQILLNTNIEGILLNKIYYSEYDITDGSYYIYDNGGVQNVEDANDPNTSYTPFNLREPFETDIFSVTFFGSVESQYNLNVTVTPQNYYNENVSLTIAPELVVTQSPPNGNFTFNVGQYYEQNSLESTYKFYLANTDPAVANIGAGRYYTNIQISITPNN